LRDIERLQVDLWETDDLHQLQYLVKLKELGILKQVKSKVSLKVLSTLPELEVLFTSISKDFLEVIGLSLEDRAAIVTGLFQST
jgi:hypothetical protein